MSKEEFRARKSIASDIAETIGMPASLRPRLINKQARTVDLADLLRLLLYHTVMQVTKGNEFWSSCGRYRNS